MHSCTLFNRCKQTIAIFLIWMFCARLAGPACKMIPGMIWSMSHDTWHMIWVQRSNDPPAWPALHHRGLNNIISMQTNTARPATKINDAETTKYGCNHGLYHDYHHEHGGKIMHNSWLSPSSIRAVCSSQGSWHRDMSLVQASLGLICECLPWWPVFDEILMDTRNLVLMVH